MLQWTIHYTIGDYYQIGLNVTERIIPYMKLITMYPQIHRIVPLQGFSMGAMLLHIWHSITLMNSATSVSSLVQISVMPLLQRTLRMTAVLLQNRVDQTIALAYLQEVDENIVPSEDLLNAVVFTMAGSMSTQAVYANGFAP